MTNIEKLIERMGWKDIKNAPIEEKILVKPNDIGKYIIGIPAVCVFRLNELYNPDGTKVHETYKPDKFINIPTGKEGEIMRVLVEALRKIDEWQSFEQCYCEKCGYGNKMEGSDVQSQVQEALAKAEELAGEV